MSKVKLKTLIKIFLTIPVIYIWFFSITFGSNCNESINVCGWLENDFIEASNLLFTAIGSALFIEASSAFEISDIKLLKSDLENVEPKTSKTKTLSTSKPELIKSHDTKLDDKLGVLQNQLIEFNNLLSLNFSDILDELTVYYQQI